ncbi:hypothetical protein BDW69DRAFT_114954 [Aspergillus filifer]
MPTRKASQTGQQIFVIQLTNVSTSKSLHHSADPARHGSLCRNLRLFRKHPTLVRSGPRGQCYALSSLVCTALLLIKQSRFRTNLIDVKVREDGHRSRKIFVAKRPPNVVTVVPATENVAARASDAFIRSLAMKLAAIQQPLNEQ